MARRLNKIQVIGYLGRDPEMTYTPNGTAVTEFSMAVNPSHREAVR
jgi:single-strand DNA-binding protein